MSKPDSTHRDSQSAKPISKKAAEIRIDTPHLVQEKGPVQEKGLVREKGLVCKKGGTPTPAVKSAAKELQGAAVGKSGNKNKEPAGAGAPTVTEQLRNQAAQLSTHLRARQQELDHRESLLNARIAQLDSGARSARLWFGERRKELEERGSALCKQQQEIQSRLKRLATAEAAGNRCRKGSDNEATETEERLKRNQAELDAMAKRLDAQTAAQKEAQQSFDRRQQELDQAEALLAEARSDMENLREELIRKRQQIDEEARLQRQRMAAEQRRAQDELDKKRQSLERRGEHVDHCRAALQELRAELERMHRETLEIRLATEELWVQLSGAAPPAVLTRSLGQIRARLADHYRLAGSELDEQKEELQTIRCELAEQHEKLLQQKQQIEEWSGRRQEEIQQQAARLVAREQELEHQQSQFEESAQQWHAERLDYEQEIRRLRQQPRAPEAAIASV